MKNIVLIGFMGVGKGTLARYMAKKYDLFAIDTDDLIESMENRKIKDIFEEDGEQYFRDLEQKCAKWLSTNVKNSIISTGGGFYMTKYIKDVGKIVYLDSSFDGIYKRLKEHKNSEKKFAKRPLFKTKDRAKELYNKRTHDYKKIADIIINVENKNLSDIGKEIKKLLNYDTI